MVANAIAPLSFNVSASIEAVKQLSEIVSGLREQVFRPGHDFGVIPGTGEKPTLLLPGMEKLMRALRLRAEYHAVSITEDFANGLFAYRYECRLIEFDTGLCVATAIGSCNSKESKYRWREQKRKCPKCGKETINKSKFAPKGKPDEPPGWYCYSKVGGCGAEFAHDDKNITEQPVGRVENPDIFDQVNTIDKIAQKRALGSAIKGAANVSEHFTVDLEDLYRFEDVVEGTFTEVKSESEVKVVALTPDNVIGIIKTIEPQPAPVEDAPENYPNLRSVLRDSGFKSIASITVKDSGFLRVEFNGLMNAAVIRPKLVEAFADRLGAVANGYFDVKWSEGAKNEHE